MSVGVMMFLLFPICLLLCYISGHGGSTLSEFSALHPRATCCSRTLEMRHGNLYASPCLWQIVRLVSATLFCFCFLNWRNVGYESQRDLTRTSAVCFVFVLSRNDLRQIAVASFSEDPFNLAFEISVRELFPF